MEFDGCVLRVMSRLTLGTPIVNGVNDLYAQMRFLRYTGGFAEQAIFDRLIRRPLSQGNPHAVAILQKLMAGVCLRRKKDMEFQGEKILHLPGVDEYLHKIGIFLVIGLT